MHQTISICQIQAHMTTWCILTLSCALLSEIHTQLHIDFHNYIAWYTITKHDCPRPHLRLFHVDLQALWPLGNWQWLDLPVLASNIKFIYNRYDITAPYKCPQANTPAAVYTTHTTVMCPQLQIWFMALLCFRAHRVITVGPRGSDNIWVSQKVDNIDTEP